ncbi:MULTISPECIES: recombinase family protein [Burkholderiales]|jgi:DNA invertase Pin-like site-specific DNA recombinase|uniref:recombinase family protein n=1 Tax=Burkholderiales TaxID=80840 RepID=UPI000BC9DDBD|nr:MULTISPECIES: recombinase family protein [Burkholderiales]OYZ13408.1 MAG: transposase [Polaromonas sp. 16-63-31]OZA75444.1 MAG: transposase [Polynucleobacter sp. 39-46-10]HQS64925.1 recombinase family protein [Acidovorax defluvii]
MSTAKTATSGKRIGYVRVSSADQNDARQLESFVLDKTFTDKASGKDTNRPQLQAMFEFVREGDHIYVHSMDRLSRSLRDLQEVVELMTGKGISVTFTKENLTFEPPATGADAHKTAYSTLMLQLLGAVSQFERALIKERQREGIAIAKSKKLYKGRKPALDKAAVEKLQQMVADGISKVEIAETLGISRASVYVYLNA